MMPHMNEAIQSNEMLLHSEDRPLLESGLQENQLIRERRASGQFNCRDQLTP
jgi:hypothetical protein